MIEKLVRFACPNCKKRLKATRPVEAGKTTRCPFCGCRITVPLPASSPQDQAGAGHESKILMAQYEGRDANHLPSRPAKNPLVYALSGALLVLLIGGGMLAAYTAGQSKSTAVAAGLQSPAASVADQIPAAQPSPRRPDPQHQPAAAPRLPETTPVNNGAGSPRNTSAGEAADAVSNTRGPKQGDPIEPPGPSSKDRLPVNDANRPRKHPLDLIQPVGAAGVDTSPAAVPLIVEVPVLIPADYGRDDSSGKPALIPDLSVVIRPEDAFAAVMKVDHLSKPGISTRLVITLDKTPKTPVQISVSADVGLVVDPTSVTFAANVAPIQQVIAISGDGNATMPGPSKVFYVNVAASGGGLTANSPAKIPVQVLRRNSFLLTNGLAINRSDVTSPGSATPILSNWTFSKQGLVPPILLGEQYTTEYVQLTWQGGPPARFRLYEDHMEWENPTGSGNYRPQGGTGSWQ